jgi:hypothetical protein
MKQKYQNYYVEDNEQIDALVEFAPRIREIVGEYRNERKLSSIAKRLGINPARLTEIITRDDTGNFRRNITPYYLGKLLGGGIVTVRQILGDRQLEDLPDRLRLYFERFMLPKKTIQLVVGAQDRGIDVEKILQEILYPSMKNTETST